MIKRRHFLGGLLSLGTTALLAHTPEGVASPKKTKRPKRLQAGDTIGLVAPGFSVSQKQIAAMTQFLENAGFKVFQTGRMGQHGYFSNTDQERATDLNEMFSNPEIDAILCARGGYGCTRILDLIDYQSIAKHPKIILGFSDVTALLQAIHKKTGLIGFHGPVGTTIENTYAQQCLSALLMEANNKTLIRPLDLKGTAFEKESVYQRYTIHKGQASGRLVGGSLTLICALIGTPYEMDFTGAIVCIEDVQEKPYRVDRMLTQLLQTKTFKKASGIIFGVCAGCDTEKNEGNFTLSEVIQNRLAPLAIPSMYGFSFGHVPDNCTLPIGAQVFIDTELFQLNIEEPVVI